ncbi:MAG TPA: hypothetical protein ENJ95_03645 [Bacteroidetes bacterium]|nr:hypothetical protein [Bacteroidota bacterium]
MELNDDTFQKINKYVRGQLPKEEAAAFESEIAADPALQEEVDMARIEMDGMEYLLEEDLRQQMADWENDAPQTGKGLKKSGSASAKWWIGVLVLAVLACLFYFIPGSDDEPAETPPTEKKELKNDPPPAIAEDKNKLPEKTPAPENKEEEIVKNEKPKTDQTKKPAFPNPDYSGYTAIAEATYNVPDYLSEGSRSIDENEPQNALTKGIRAYLDGEYKKAIKQLESIRPESDPQLYEAAQKTLAHAYFKNKQFGKAAALFKSMADKSNFNKDEPEWYLLLSLVADYGNNKAAADELLEKISGDGLHNYQGGAVKLKAKLEASKNR